VSDNYVPGMGLTGCSVMLLGEAPSMNDVKRGRPFSDTKDLDILLKDAGIYKSSCWMTNVFKEPIPPSPTRKKVPAFVRAEQAGLNIRQSLLELQNEINDVKPNVIIGLGGTALWALTGIKPKSKKKKNEDDRVALPAGGITDYRGSILMGMGRKIVCTYNPAQLSWGASDIEFIGYWNRQVILADLKRAKEESYTDVLSPPQRTIEICKSLEDIKRFRYMYRGRTDVAVDIEAGGHYLPACIGFAFSRSHAMVVPLWNINEYRFITDAEMVLIWQEIQEICRVGGGERLQYELFKITGFNLNVNSPKQVAFLLFEELKCPRRNGTSEEELTSLLNLQSFTDPTKRLILEKILEKRRVDKSIGTYLMALPDYDGRMRTTYFPCLDTGRSKTGQQDPPIRPTIEIVDYNGKKKKKAMGTAFQTMTKHGDIGEDVRSMYIPG
jgi:uracil-DNA glycosylase family 4